MIKKGAKGSKKQPQQQKQSKVEQKRNPYIAPRQKTPDKATPPEPEIIPKEIIVHHPKRVKYCSACGMEFSEKVKNILKSRGNAFCEYCGKIHKVMEQPIEG
ncbi:MAG: hypothetical protein BAJALOKI1v1_1850004 [Promethearchaeota archaeon]|nr:MAG: hypothetical protein BAJALOKI1v1_1850004 [Candidatus Lokiarchaeota archaeon]